jgi:amino acid adenylation domain-containing protein
VHDADIQDSYLLTPIQEGMLFDHEIAPGSGANIVQIAGVLHEPVDPALLERAWRSVVGRNPVLRTSFHWAGDGPPVQRVHRSVDAGVLLLDWSMKSPVEGRDLFDAHLREDRRRGFDPGVPPLVRLAAFTMGTGLSFLVLSLHHILLDGHAFPLLLDELFSTYESLRAGRSPVREEPVPFRAYVEYVHRQNHDRSESFWREYLGGFTDATPLPPESGPGFQGGAFLEFGRCDIRLSPQVLAGLRDLAAASGGRLSTVFHAAWGLLLGRYSGATDVVFGETRACRRSTVDGAERILGCCINTVPLRVRIGPEAPLKELLRQLRSDNSAVREHEQTPLGRIRGWSPVAGGRPLFETLLVYDHVGLTALMRSGGGAGCRREFSVLSHTHFPLVFEVQGEEGVLRLTYSRARFTPPTAERMLGHIQTMLASMASRGDQRVGEIPLLTETEERRILLEWNAEGANGGPALCVHELIEVQTEQTPEAVAVSCGKETWTYRDLNNRASLLGRHLSALGVGPEVVVGIALERSCEMMMCLLGILKAGGAYLPLDPSLPEERRRYILEDARPSFVITSRNLGGLFSSTGAVLIFPEEIPVVDSPGGGVTGTHAPGRAGPGNAAYVIYTSGSTGRPKGTVVLHRGLSNYLLWCTEAYDVRRGGVSLVHSPLGFDLTVTALYSPLLRGGTVRLLPESSRPEDLCTELLEHPDNALVKITPAHLELLAALMPPGAGAALTTTFVVGGEDLKADLAARWQSIAPDALLFNEYGPTETVVGCSVYRIPPGIPAAGSVPIGRPIANMRLYVLDHGMRPVPAGVPGELCIGGAGVARGYLNLPALTAERFVRDPFSGDPSSRLYRSGDVARYLPDGILEFLGRADDQVKIRGYRIEPGEIESVLLEHDGVREAAVIARKGPNGERRLEAYFVPAGEPPPTGDALRAHARRLLPEYMVPAAFLRLDSMPLNSNRKVDRRALSVRVNDPAFEQGATKTSMTPIEGSLKSLWEELLGVRGLNAADNFFEVGGHSLAVIQLVSRIRARWRIDLRISDVFNAPTVSALASAIERRLLEEIEGMSDEDMVRERNALFHTAGEQPNG